MLAAQKRCLYGYVLYLSSVPEWGCVATKLLCVMIYYDVTMLTPGPVPYCYIFGFLDTWQVFEACAKFQAYTVIVV